MRGPRGLSRRPFPAACRNDSQRPRCYRPPAALSSTSKSRSLVQKSRLRRTWTCIRSPGCFFHSARRASPMVL